MKSKIHLYKNLLFKSISKKTILTSTLFSLSLMSCYRDATKEPENTGNGSKDFNPNAQTDNNAGDSSKRIKENPGNQTQQDTTKY